MASDQGARRDTSSSRHLLATAEGALAADEEQRKARIEALRQRVQASEGDQPADAQATADGLIRYLTSGVRRHRD